MFAPPGKASKAKTASPSVPTRALQPPQHRFGSPVGDLNNQAMLRHGSQSAESFAAHKSSEPSKQEDDPAAAVDSKGWDLTRIPAFARDRAYRPQPSSPLLQPKLTIGQINDRLEHEADRVADHVLRMPDSGVPLISTPPRISPKWVAREVEEKLHKKPTGTGEAAASDVPGSVHEVLRSPGQSLDPRTRAYFEQRFGHDFSDVRVHSDARASASAEAVGARAYTVGKHIVLGEGQTSHETAAGRLSLSHELAHVVQQSRGGPSPVISRFAPHERDAHAAATAIAAGVSNVQVKCNTGVGLAREEKATSLPELLDPDPESSPRYIDIVFQRVSFSWLNGATTFKWNENGKEKKVTVPLKDLMQDDTRTFVALHKVHNSKIEALKTVALYTKAGPGFEYYSFYRGPEGVIMPTSFSIKSTPQFHALWPGLKEQISESAEDIRKGMQQLANVINPLPGTKVDEYGNLSVSGDPMDWLALLKLRRLGKIKKAGPIKIKRHSGYNVPYRVTGPHGKLKGTSVYVLKDAEGTVLYVGKGETLNRLREHIKDPKKTQWFGEIAHIEVRGTDLSNTQALALEENLIGQLQPLHNVDRHPFRKEFGDAMEVGPNLPRTQGTLNFFLEWGD